MKEQTNGYQHYVLRMPPILVSKEDYDDLSRIAVSASPQMYSAGYFLLRELDRASIIDLAAMPSGVVRMYARVT